MRQDQRNIHVYLRVYYYCKQISFLSLVAELNYLLLIINTVCGSVLQRKYLENADTIFAYFCQRIFKYTFIVKHITAHSIDFTGGFGSH